MAFDDENEPGDELEDFGDELSSDYKEEAEEGLGDEGEELEEEVSYEIEETVTTVPVPEPAPVALRRVPAKKPLAAQNTTEGLTLTVPATAPDPVSSTIVLEVKGPLDIVQPGLAQDYDGSVVLPASEARLHGNEIKYETGHQRDNLGGAVP